MPGMRRPGRTDDLRAGGSVQGIRMVRDRLRKEIARSRIFRQRQQGFEGFERVQEGREEDRKLLERKLLQESRQAQMTSVGLNGIPRFAKAAKRGAPSVSLNP